VTILAIRSPILRLECNQIQFWPRLRPRTSWSSTPDPAGGGYSAPPCPLAGFKGPTSKRREGRGKQGREEKDREGEVARRREREGRRGRISHIVIPPLWHVWCSHESWEQNYEVYPWGYLSMLGSPNPSPLPSYDFYWLCPCSIIG